MTREYWAQLQSLFDEALSLGTEGRRRVIDRVSAQDHALALEVSKLLHQYDEATSFLGKPAVPQWQGRAIEPGTMLDGRFEIVHLIGSGGMGEVYLVRDSELEELIALKLLPDQFGNSESMIARLRREVLLARRISHPNVCRIHDFGKHAAAGITQYFLTMEYVDGVTLAQWLAKGRQTLEAIKPILLEILDGLEAAHTTGVLHRDLKPSNVMLRHTPLSSGHRIVITDFGLAEGSWASDASGQAGRRGLVGTPMYMAPEQIEGIESSPKIDLYAFGLLMYEVFLGERLHAGEDPLAAIVKRSRAGPGSVAARVNGLEHHWDLALSACLDPDPVRRPSSATELKRRLAQKSFHGGVPFNARISRRQIVTAGLTTAAATAAAIWRFGTSATPMFPAQVLVADIENQTGDELVDAVRPLLRSQLEQSTQFNVVDPERVRTLVQQLGQPLDSKFTPELIREVAWRMNCPMVVFGTILRVGADYQLAVQIEGQGSSPQEPSPKSTTFGARDRRGLLTAIREASTWVRLNAGEPAQRQHLYDRLPEDVTTASWEALTYYSRADQLALQQKNTEAVLMLDAALDRDSGFTLASMRKADVLASMGHKSESLLQWRRTIQLLAKRKVTRREELRILGMFAFDTEDYAISERYFSQWAVEFPNDYRGHFYRTVPLILDGHAQDALGNLKLVRTLAPWYGAALGQMANCSLALRDYSEAARFIEEWRKMGEANRADRLEGVLRFCRLDFEGAIQMFRRMKASADASTRARGALHEVIVLAETGAREKALLTGRSALDEPSSEQTQSIRAQIGIACAWVAFTLDRGIDAGDFLESARNSEAGIDYLQNSIQILARMGKWKTAGQRMQELQQFGETRLYNRLNAFVLGEKAYQGKRFADAVQGFGQLSDLRPKSAYQLDLARALEGAGEGDESRTLRRRVAASPNLIWLLPLSNPVGAWFESVQSMAANDSEMKNLTLTMQRFRRSIP